MNDNVYEFPTPLRVIKDRGKEIRVEEDSDYILAACEIILNQTDYQELIIVGLRTDNAVEVVHSETDQRAVEILDRAIEEVLIGA